MSARTTIAIPPHVATILRNAKIVGTHLSITQQLDRKVYEDCNKILAALGGKWNRSAKAHIFPKPVAEVLSEALDDGEVVNMKNLLQRFYTPEYVATSFINRLGDLGESMVLEPSAGEGALVKALLSAGAWLVIAIEMDPEACEKLRELALQHPKRLKVIEGDFLKFRNDVGYKFDLAVMNPPFTRGQDAEHIRKALTWAPDVYSIAPPTIFDRIEGEKVMDLPAGSFKESGTNVATVIGRFTR